MSTCIDRTIPSLFVAATLAAGAVAVGTLPGVGASEPARLMAPLNGVGSVAPALSIHTEHQTLAVQWPAEWTRGGIPEMTPCATGPKLAGAILHKVIRAKGDLRQCV